MINYPLEFTKQATPSGYFINMSFNNKIDFKWNVETYEQVCYVLDSILNFYLYKNGINDTVDSFSKFGYITLEDGSNLILPQLFITEELSPVILVEYFNNTGSYYTSYVDFSILPHQKMAQIPLDTSLEFYNDLSEKDKQLFIEKLDKDTVDLALEYLKETVEELSNTSVKESYSSSLVWSTRDFS